MMCYFQSSPIFWIVPVYIYIYIFKDSLHIASYLAIFDVNAYSVSRRKLNIHLVKPCIAGLNQEK